MQEFNFDEEIDRRAVPALKHHARVLGADGMGLFPGGVADMDFRVAPCIAEAIARRAAHGVFGYEAVPDGLLPALTDWLAARLDMVPSTLSGHLSILKRAGLLQSTRKQREIYYAADLVTVNTLVRFLLEDCCDGRIENCAEALSLLSPSVESA